MDNTQIRHSLVYLLFFAGILIVVSGAPSLTGNAVSDVLSPSSRPILGFIVIGISLLILVIGAAKKK